MGYDTCHRTKEYDAQRCYEDCQVKNAKHLVCLFQILSEIGKKWVC